MKPPTRGLLQFLARESSLIVAVCVGSGLAHSGTSTMPFQVGALIDGAGISSGQAGLFGLIEVGALALGMLLIGQWIDRLPIRTLAVASALLAASANVALFLVRAFPVQLLCAAVAGSCFGFVFAATIASAAASDEPDRLYAIGNGGALLLLMGILTTLPMVAARLGTFGIFAGIAGLAVISCLFLRGLRPGVRTERQRVAAWRIRGVPGLLFSWASFSTGTGALYAFSERIGKGIHLSSETIGVVLSGGLLVGVVGTLAAAYIAGRINRRRALGFGMLGSGLSCLLLGYASNLLLFTLGVFLYWICYMFLYSYLLGSAAQLDATGRVGTIGGGMERLGYGAGAFMGGLLAEHAGYSVTGILGFSGCVLGYLVGFPSLFRALDGRGAPVATEQGH